MYSLKISALQSSKSQNRPGGAVTEGVEGDVATASPGVVDQLTFSAGNPRVEHITGIVHLYRDVYTESLNGEDAESTMVKTNELCVMSTPPDMGFAEFCTFLGPYFEQVSEIRLVRKDGGSLARHLVLLTFESQSAADGFYQEYNGKPFCLLEPELVCHLLFVRNVEYTFEEKCEDEEVSVTAPQGTTELPSCPVCLERLDGSVSGIVTTVCNHRFHNQCLRQWVDSSCPVCRYCQHPSEASLHHCVECKSSVDLWMCLICGHVGCGRYKGSHAANHFEATGHGYALELESQRIWDYAQDTYVHRLVCHKVHGIPEEEEKCHPCPPRTAAHPHSRSQEYDDAIVKSKMDALTTEFTHIMVSQLETQRAYFENIVESHHKETEAILESTRAAWCCSKATAEAADAAAQRAESTMRQVQHKNQDLRGKLEKSQKEQEFLRQLNETLLSNQKAFSEKMKAAESRETTMRAEIIELKEQVRDLMMFIEARDAIEKSGSDASGGTVLPVAQPKRRSTASRRR